MKQRLSFMAGGARKSSFTGGGGAPPTPEPMGGASAAASATPMPEGLGGASSSSPSGAAAMSIGGGSASKSSRGSGLGAGMPISPKTSGLQPSSAIKSRNKSMVEGMGAMTISAAAHGGAINDKLIVLRTGPLKKKGVINTGWKKRFFVLTDKELAYYDEEPKDLDEEVPKGIVSLEQISKVEHHSEKSKDDFMFDIITPARVYRVQAESISEMEAWIATISGTAANAQMHSRKRGTQGIVRDMTEDSALQGEDISAAFGGPHQPADLRKWELWNAYDVSAWLQTFGMSKHRKKFYAAGITGTHLKGLSSESLAQLGVTEKMEQIKILSQVQKLMSGAL